MQLELSEKCFEQILEVIHSFTGITISKNRTSMVEGRMRKRVRALNLNSYEDYLQLVKTNTGERQVFIDLITTNETYFYRTPRVWEYIEKKFLPNWYEKNKGETFLCWSAASSSGEEAHTFAIICEDFKSKNPGFTYKIFGTDISQEMVSRCREGIYSGRSIENFKNSRSDLFLKFMVSKDQVNFQVLPEIKARMSFQQHNLFDALKAPASFDIILIRNVLIYFTGEDQEKVLSLLAPKLKIGGRLIIGESESLSHIKTDFKHSEPLIYEFSDSNVQRQAG